MSTISPVTTAALVTRVRQIEPTIEPQTVSSVIMALAGNPKNDPTGMAQVRTHEQTKLMKTAMSKVKSYEGLATRLLTENGPMAIRFDRAVRRRAEKPGKNGATTQELIAGTQPMVPDKPFTLLMIRTLFQNRIDHLKAHQDLEAARKLEEDAVRTLLSLLDLAVLLTDNAFHMQCVAWWRRSDHGRVTAMSSLIAQEKDQVLMDVECLEQAPSHFQGICARFNLGTKCSAVACDFAHVCWSCQIKDHGASECPKLQSFIAKLIKAKTKVIVKYGSGQRGTPPERGQYNNRGRNSNRGQR